MICVLDAHRIQRPFTHHGRNLTTLSDRQSWLRVAILVGMIYFAAAFTASALAGAASSNRMILIWRWSAFVVSALAFAGHITYEQFRQFRLGNRAIVTAGHASVGAAVGGFALALWANIHDLGSATGYRPRMLVALVAWPLLTGVPAFIIALIIAAGLALKPRRV